MLEDGKKPTIYCSSNFAQTNIILTNSCAVIIEYFLPEKHVLHPHNNLNASIFIRPSLSNFSIKSRLYFFFILFFCWCINNLCFIAIHFTLPHNKCIKGSMCGRRFQQNDGCVVETNYSHISWIYLWNLTRMKLTTSFVLVRSK